MNVILAIRQGIPDDPILIKNNIKAEAAYEKLAEELGVEWTIPERIGDGKYDVVDRYLEGSGNELRFWNVSIE